MKPARPGLADAVRILEVSKRPIGAKSDGHKARRMAIVPGNERGLASTMGANGLFYANTVCTFGAVSAGGNWGRLAIAAHRWALKPVGNNDFPFY